MRRSNESQAHLVEGWVQLAGLDGLDGGNGFQAARCPKAVSDHALGGIHLDCTGVAEHLVQRSDLSNIAHLCAGCMRIDVVHLQFSSSQPPSYRNAEFVRQSLKWTHSSAVSKQWASAWIEALLYAVMQLEERDRAHCHIQFSF